MATPRLPSGKAWATELSKTISIRALVDASPQKLDELAAAAVEKAIAGDTSAAAFIRDTMDGKPAQQLEHIGEQPVTLRTMVTTVQRDHHAKPNRLMDAADEAAARHNLKTH